MKLSKTVLMLVLGLAMGGVEAPFYDLDYVPGQEVQTGQARGLAEEFAGMHEKFRLLSDASDKDIVDFLAKDREFLGGYWSRRMKLLKEELIHRSGPENAQFFPTFAGGIGASMADTLNKALRGDTAAESILSDWLNYEFRAYLDGYYVEGSNFNAKHNFEYGVSQERLGQLEAQGLSREEALIEARNDALRLRPDSSELICRADMLDYCSLCRAQSAEAKARFKGIKRIIEREMQIYNELMSYKPYIQLLSKHWNVVYISTQTPGVKCWISSGNYYDDYDFSSDEEDYSHRSFVESHEADPQFRLDMIKLGRLKGKIQAGSAASGSSAGQDTHEGAASGSGSREASDPAAGTPAGEDFGTAGGNMQFPTSQSASSYELNELQMQLMQAKSELAAQAGAEARLRSELAQNQSTEATLKSELAAAQGGSAGNRFMMEQQLRSELKEAEENAQRAAQELSRTTGILQGSKRENRELRTKLDEASNAAEDLRMSQNSLEQVKKQLTEAKKKSSEAYSEMQAMQDELASEREKAKQEASKATIAQRREAELRNQLAELDIMRTELAEAGIRLLQEEMKAASELRKQRSEAASELGQVRTEAMVELAEAEDRTALLTSELAKAQKKLGVEKQRSARSIEATNQATEQLAERFASYEAGMRVMQELVRQAQEQTEQAQANADLFQEELRGKDAMAMDEMARAGTLKALEVIRELEAEIQNLKLRNRRLTDALLNGQRASDLSEHSRGHRSERRSAVYNEEFHNGGPRRHNMSVGDSYLVVGSRLSYAPNDLTAAWWHSHADPSNPGTGVFNLYPSAPSEERGMPEQATMPNAATGNQADAQQLGSAAPTVSPFMVIELPHNADQAADIAQV